MHRFVRYTLPLLLMLGMMFYVSGDWGSTKHTRPALRSILWRVAPALAARLHPEQVNRIDYNIRKTAHVTEYCLLAVLAYRAVRRDSTRFQSRQILFPILLGVGYAAGDEWHQSFVPSRTSSVEDILYDSLGVMLGSVLCQWRAQLQQLKQNKPHPQRVEPVERPEV